MKRIAIAVVLLMAVGSLAYALPAETVKGTIIDTACYTAGKHGAEQKGCTEMCINMGVPPSLLTADGDVVLLLPMADQNTEPYEEAKALAAEEVEIEGMQVERGGMKAIMVQSVKKAN